MKIIKKRIINLDPYIATIRNGEEFHIAFNGFNENLDRINQIGFTNPQVGEQILPAILGPVSRYNANGRFNIRRDLPKEEFFVERLGKWKDYQGNEYEKITFTRRERYPRELVPPPGEELLVDSYEQNNIIVSRAFIKEEEAYGVIKHTLNLFLELFGECDLIRENYDPFVYNNITRLNWKILPQGEYPWPTVREVAQERIDRQPAGNRPVIANRLEIISAHVPNFVAVGRGGFYDYMVFGFPVKNIFILESIKTGNATYVFGKDWEELSKLTKAEILNNNLQEERVFHSPTWEARINEILG